MARHLRPVESAPPETSYVVARSRHVRPGWPYVVAACADHAVAEVLALAGLEILAAGEMSRRPDLAAALASWEAGDHKLHRSERAAALAFARDLTGGSGRAAHPSVLSKILP